MNNKGKQFTVDGWISAEGKPYIQLVTPTGRDYVLTLTEVRQLMCDIREEILRLDGSRTEETDNDSN